MVKPTPRAGELVTANYGWTKPEVGASVDAWGGYINTDLDGIDSTVHSIQTSVPAASSTTPAMDGTAAVGTETTWARADHVHPSDTSRYAASNPSGYQTAAQVASVVIGDNRIINGDMRIDQRWNGASIALGGTGGYTVDRWQYVASKTGKFSGGRNYIGIIPAQGFQYYLGFQVASAYTPAAGETFLVLQFIEADMVGDLAWGGAGAQPVTLSFWVFIGGGLSGTFTGSIINAANTRSYPFTFSVPTPNAWTKIAVTIPGDTSGTWTLSGNAAAMAVRFDLGSGATYRGTPNIWQAGNIVGATGAVNVVGTNSAVFFLTGVKLEIGGVATPFNRQSLAKSMADCQRYYQGGAYAWLSGYNIAGNGSGETLTFPAMRAAPSFTATNTSFTNCSTLTTTAVTPFSLGFYVLAIAAGGLSLSFNYTLSAEL